MAFFTSQPKTAAPREASQLDVKVAYHPSDNAVEMKGVGNPEKENADCLCNIAFSHTGETLKRVDQIQMRNKDQMVGFILAQMAGSKRGSAKDAYFVVAGMTAKSWEDVYAALKEAALVQHQSWTLTRAEFKNVYEASPVIYVSAIFGAVGYVLGGVTGMVFGSVAKCAESGYRKGARCWLYVVKGAYALVSDEEVDVVRTEGGAKLLIKDEVSVVSSTPAEAKGLDEFRPPCASFNLQIMPSQPLAAH